jgi:hypothetical protein
MRIDLMKECYITLIGRHQKQSTGKDYYRTKMYIS